MLFSFLLNLLNQVNDFELNKEDFELLWSLNKNEKVSWDSTDVI